MTTHVPTSHAVWQYNANPHVALDKLACLPANWTHPCFASSPILQACRHCAVPKRDHAALICLYPDRFGVGLQANVDTSLLPEEWPLDALAAKMKQYCYLLGDLTGDVLKSEANGDYEALRSYLRKRSVDAYYQKVRACPSRATLTNLHYATIPSIVLNVGLA